MPMLTAYWRAVSQVMESYAMQTVLSVLYSTCDALLRPTSSRFSVIAVIAYPTVHIGKSTPGDTRGACSDAHHPHYIYIFDYGMIDA